MRRLPRQRYMQSRTLCINRHFAQRRNERTGTGIKIGGIALRSVLAIAFDLAQVSFPTNGFDEVAKTLQEMEA
jgi:hypothetical protein